MFSVLVTRAKKAGVSEHLYGRTFVEGLLEVHRCWSSVQQRPNRRHIEERQAKLR